MTYLVGDIVTRSLRLAGIIGIGQRMSSDDAQTTMDALSDILAQWQVQRWLVYGLTTSSITANGALSYSIGPGGDFNMVRPERIESAFMRFKNTGTVTVDRPLALINAREDYNLLSVKNIGSVPNSVFYDNAFPLGNLFFWPVPLSATCDLFVTTKIALPQISSMTQVLSMPPEYIAPLRYELASVLRAEYTLPPNAKIEALMTKGKSILRNANAQVPTLRLGVSVPGGHSGVYNPYSDGR